MVRLVLPAFGLNIKVLPPQVQGVRSSYILGLVILVKDHITFPSVPNKTAR